jgi:hypothetical protein
VPRAKVPHVGPRASRAPRPGAAPLAATTESQSKKLPQQRQKQQGQQRRGDAAEGAAGGWRCAVTDCGQLNPPEVLRCTRRHCPGQSSYARSALEQLYVHSPSVLAEVPSCPPWTEVYDWKTLAVGGLPAEAWLGSFWTSVAALVASRIGDATLTSTNSVATNSTPRSSVGGGSDSGRAGSGRQSRTKSTSASKGGGGGGGGAAATAAWEDVFASLDDVALLPGANGVLYAVGARSPTAV